MVRYVNRPGVNSWSSASSWFRGVSTNMVTGNSITNNNTTGIFTSTFTAPDTVSSNYGVLFYLRTKGTNTFTTVYLQEDTTGSGGWVDVASNVITWSDVSSVETMVRVDFTTPYQYTTTSAGRYRYRFVSNLSNGTLQGDSSGTLVAFIGFDDRDASFPLVNVDEAYIMSEPSATTKNEIIITTTCGVGLGTTTTYANSSTTFLRSFDAHLRIMNGILRFEPINNLTFTYKCNVLLEERGEFICDLTDNEYNVILQADNSSSSNAHSIYSFSENNKCVIKGRQKPFYNTMYVSGQGTTASPLVVSDSVNWDVGDRLKFSFDGLPSGTADFTETRYIIEKINPTTYRLSDTVGGGETSFIRVKTTNVRIFNCERTITMTTNNARQFRIWSRTLATNNNVFEDVHLISCAFFRPIFEGANSGGVVNNVCLTDCATNCFLINSTKVPLTFNNVLFNNPTQLAFSLTSGCNNKTFNGLYFLGNSSTSNHSTFSITNTYAVVINDLFMNNTVRSTNVSSARSFNVTTSNFVVNHGSITGNIGNNITLATTIASSFNFVTIGEPLGGNGIVFTADVYIDVLFSNCTIRSDVFSVNSDLMLLGSEARFQNINLQPNNHRWLTPTGNGRSTGASLEDTTTRTVGSLAVRLNSFNSEDGMLFDLFTIARPQSAINIFGFIKLNTAFINDITSSVIINFYLPNTGDVYQSVTVAKVEGWQLWSFTGFNDNNETLLSRIEFNIKATDNTAYVYIDDVFNGTNKLTAMDLWFDGKPVPVMFEQLGDPVSVWNVPLSSLNVPNSTGRKMKDSLTIGSFIGLNN